MRPDLVSVIESVYRVEQDTPSWIRGILEPVAEWLGDDRGVFGFAYCLSPEGELRVDPESFAALYCSDEQLRALPVVATLHEPLFVRRTLASDFTAVSTIPGWRESEGRSHAVRFGVSDAWALFGRNPGGRGSGVFINRREEGRPAAGDERLLVRVATHLAAAHRLRERLKVAKAIERAEAVIEPGGNVQHAIGTAKLRDSLEALQSGVRAIDRARGRLRKNNPESAVRTWKGLVAARWTLIDCFESDGRRFVLAQENAPAPEPYRALSERERQVVANAAMGRSNKEIAYALGLADSTVRVLITRAARKLRASTRNELLRKFDELGRS